MVLSFAPSFFYPSISLPLLITIYIYLASTLPSSSSLSLSLHSDGLTGGPAPHKEDLAYQNPPAPPGSRLRMEVDLSSDVPSQRTLKYFLNDTQLPVYFTHLPHSVRLAVCSSVFLSLSLHLSPSSLYS